MNDLPIQLSQNKILLHNYWGHYRVNNILYYWANSYLIFLHL